MHYARDYEMRIVASVYVSKQCAPEEDIVPGERYEHCMLDVVITSLLAMQSRASWAAKGTTSVKDG
jgi:hypothetical protein